MIAAYIAGLVWRLRTSGRFASGDIMPEDVTEEQWYQEITSDEPSNYYQYSSGRFIWILLVISWVILGLCCCALCTTPCIMFARLSHEQNN